MHPPFARSIALATVLAIVLGFGRAAPVTGADGVTVDGAGAQRIVALNSSVLETLFELGLGERVVGTDDSGTYPENDLPKVGHPYNYPVEGIISLAPDLVLSAQENMKPETATQLRDAGIAVLVLADSGRGGMVGLYERVDQIAAALDAPGAGRRLIARLQAEVAELQASIAQLAPEAERPAVLFVYSHSLGDSTIYGGPDTGPGTLITLAGARDAGAFVNAGHVAITSEALVTANPDAIVMLERGLEAVGGVDGYLQLPGVALTKAGTEKAVYTVDNSVRWIGPRFPEFARRLAERLYGVNLPVTGQP